MIAVKIECGCGQRFAFDVEPVNGQMASAVACPTCGADGTAAANEVIASNLAPSSPPPFTANSPQSKGVVLKITSVEQTAPASSKITADARQLGIVDQKQAETEARAKISWGDSPEEVIKYLMIQRFSYQEASELVKVMFKERMVAVRTKGFQKILVGFGLMLVPVIAFGCFAHLGVISIKLMGIALAVGIWGIWQLLNGVVALIAPKMESGDVAEQ